MRFMDLYFDTDKENMDDTCLNFCNTREEAWIRKKLLTAQLIFMFKCFPYIEGNASNEKSFIT